MSVSEALLWPRNESEIEGARVLARLLGSSFRRGAPPASSAEELYTSDSKRARARSSRNKSNFAREQLASRWNIYFHPTKRLSLKTKSHVNFNGEQFAGLFESRSKRR